jgi:hypothetical protein
MSSRALALATFASLFALSAASAAPQYVRVSWTNPTETATTMTVTWNTDSVANPSVVQYGTSASYGLEAEGSALQSKGPLGAIHEVELTGLDPDTVYHYRVGGPGDWSENFSFRTGVSSDGCEPVRFVAMGDGRSDDSFGPSPKWSSILTEAILKEPAFVVLTGDQVKEGDEVDQWVNWLEATASGSWALPIMPSLGNHDDDNVDGDGAMYNQIFSLPPNESSGTEDFYFFTYGDAIFVSLSMMTFNGDGFAQQAAWLDKVLTDNPRTWKFVFFHHPIYTGVLGIPGLLELNHPPNELGQNAALVPVFDEHQVDMVLMGHNHHYQRFVPMCCGGGDDMGVPTGSTETGTTYVITGGAGALTYDASILGIDLPGLLCLTPNSAHCDGRHHFMVIDIDGLDLSVEVWATSAQLLGSSPANIALIDEFEIHKEGPEPVCDVPIEPDVTDPPDVAEPENDAGEGADAADSSDAAPGEDTGISGPDGATGGGDAADSVQSDGAQGDGAGPGPDAGAKPDTDAAGWVPPAPDTGSAPGGKDTAGGGAESSSKGDDGCRATPGEPGPTGLAVGLLLGFALATARRRSRAALAIRLERG